MKEILSIGRLVAHHSKLGPREMVFLIHISLYLSIVIIPDEKSGLSSEMLSSFWYGYLRLGKMKVGVNTENVSLVLLAVS